jgi:hypothetical protein
MEKRPTSMYLDLYQALMDLVGLTEEHLMEALSYLPQGLGHELRGHERVSHDPVAEDLPQ